MAKFEFQNLTVYQKAKLFHRQSIQLVEKHQIKNYSKDQLKRASFSIALNIAEGSGRFSKADRKNFFVISRSSVFECVAILDIFRDEKNYSRSRLLQLRTPCR